MMHEEPQAVTVTRLEIAVERLIAVVQYQDEKLKVVLDLLFEEDSVANLEEADMGMLGAIREVYNKPGRYVPHVEYAARPQEEERDPAQEEEDRITALDEEAADRIAEQIEEEHGN